MNTEQTIIDFSMPQYAAVWVIYAISIVVGLAGCGAEVAVTASARSGAAPAKNTPAVSYTPLEPPSVSAPAPAPAPAPIPPDPPPKKACFQLIDSTLYSNKPDFAGMGFKSVPAIDPYQWLAEAPTGSSIQEAVTEHAAQNPTTPVVFDDESGSIQELADLISWTRAGGSTAPLGFYGSLPVRDYWDAVAGPQNPGYIAWQAKNSALQPIAAEVAALYPSLYTFYDDAEGWSTYANANLSEARRISQGKPIYPFLWPQYHTSAPADIALTYIEVAFWQTELQTVYASADGLVLWGGWDYANNRPQQWDESAPWWQATKAFIATIPNLCTA